MSERAPGFYWVGRLGYAAVCHWDGVAWRVPGCGDVEKEIVAIIPKADVLAGPLRLGDAEQSDRILKLAREFAEAEARGEPIDDAVSGDVSGGGHDAELEPQEAAKFQCGSCERFVDIVGVTCSKCHASITALRSRARALLEGTTPGPWDVSTEGPHTHEIMHGRFHVGGPFSDANDVGFVVGAHTLLTELAKEEA